MLPAISSSYGKRKYDVYFWFEKLNASNVCCLFWRKKKKKREIKYFLTSSEGLVLMQTLCTARNEIRGCSSQSQTPAMIRFRFQIPLLPSVTSHTPQHTAVSPHSVFMFIRNRKWFILHCCLRGWDPKYWNDFCENWFYFSFPLHEVTPSGSAPFSRKLQGPFFPWAKKTHTKV